MVNTEKFEQAWYPGEGLVTNVLLEHDQKTTLILTVRYESREARNLVLKSGMEEGLVASYERLAELVTANFAAERIKQQ